MSTLCLLCSQENAAGALFCTRCGSSVGAACPACGAPNAVGSRFCAQCSAELTPATEAPNPGSTKASPPAQVLDPSQLQQLLKKLCDRCATANEVAAQFCHHCGWSLANAPVAAAEATRPAGFWLRLAAYLLDTIILGIGAAIVLGVLGGADLLSQPSGVWPNVISQGVGLLYFTIGLGIWGGTPGKLALGLRVVRTSGGKVSLLRAFFRYLAYTLSALPIGLGFLWIAFSDDKRGWHDHLCDTKVIRVR